ncbi:MAG TPA: PKD domain-containing protein [Polyangia bacterium]
MPGSHFKRRVAAAAAAIGTLATSATAHAAPAWLAPVNLVSGTSLDFGTVVAMDFAGEAVAAWAQGSSGTQVRAAIREPGGAFAPSQVLSGDLGGDAGAEQVAMDARGDALVVFAQNDGTANVIRAAFRPAGGVFGHAQTISDSVADTAAGQPQIAMSPSGVAEVAWSLHEASGTNIIEVSRRAAGGTFTPQHALTPAVTGEIAVNPTIAIDAAGDVVTAWQGNLANSSTLEAAARPAGGDYGATQTLQAAAANKFALAPKVAMTPAGRATIVFTSEDDTVPGHRSSVEFAVRPAGPPFASQSFGALGSVSDPAAPNGTFASLPQLAVDPDDTAVAVYAFRETTGSFIIQGASRPANSSFGTRQDLSAPGSAAFDPRIAMDPAGDVIASWLDDAGLGEIFAVERPHGGSFGAVLPVDQGQRVGNDVTMMTDTPSVAMDDQGNALGLFPRSDSADGGVTRTFDVRAAGFDAAPPTITSLSVPTSALTGANLLMSAAAFDRWSGASLSWSFGDGGHATGTRVSHVYRSAGSFPVTVTATDGAGNPSSLTRTVQVSAPSTCVDADHDGFCASQDCNDHDPDIRPNAREIPGNDIDENCDGIAAPFPTVSAGVTTAWSVTGSRLELTALRLTQVRHDKITLTCAGKQCPFKRKRLGTAKRSTFNGLKRLKRRQRRFHAGETLEVIVSAKHFNAKVVRYKLRRGRIPSGKSLCLPPGAAKPRNRCS